MQNNNFILKFKYLIIYLERSQRICNYVDEILDEVNQMASLSSGKINGDFLKYLQKEKEIYKAKAT